MDRARQPWSRRARPYFLFANELAVVVDPNVSPDIIVVAMVMRAVFATAIMAVDPMMTVLGPMARHPDHFIVALPVTRAMRVVWVVTDFDVKSRLSRECGPENEARRDRREQQ
jgi:hypothetical protein